MSVGAVVGRRVLLLLVAAIMAVMMSMGPALAYGGTYGTYGGGKGGGPNGGDGGGHVVKHKKYDRYHYDVCWYKWHGKWYSYYC